MGPVSAHPLEEYKILCEMMRSYAMLRFYAVWVMSLFVGPNPT